jgi:hypothetical protein
MAVHVLGIRHHGPGSARNVKDFLEQLKPDIVLVEGPPEADDILQWSIHPELKPPVAILCYQPGNPQQSSFYPFAEFSPEWQAIRYARQQNIHVRFMDLPAAHQFALEEEKIKEGEKATGKDNNPTSQAAYYNNNRFLHNDAISTVEEEPEAGILHRDPISWLAKAAGFEEGEKWWEHMFEHRQNSESVFEAVAEAMQALREALPPKEDRLEQAREAHMRKMIRQAEREMFQNIAVICGAWHVPALVNMPPVKEDTELLKGLPKVKVETTWVPWTYRKLSFFSGYGAGIQSPGWYEHLWKYPADDGTRWMTKVAGLFRKQQMDTSVAHVIEAVRLANALAALRNLSKAGLEELNEATQSILCNGEAIKMSLVGDELIVSNKMGAVPDDIPRPPLQVDIEKQQKKLRLPPTADWKDYTLDLRKETDLDRSIFLHRLRLLGIRWGEQSDVKSKGTFKEQWRLQWEPSFTIEIIEKGSWGNTTEEAASAFTIDQVQKAGNLVAVCELLQELIPAELEKSIDSCISQINNLAAASADVLELLQVIPGLVSVSRYGNVRKTDAGLITGILQSMITRVCVSLPSACVGVDEDAATVLVEMFRKMNDAVGILQQEEITGEWQSTLTLIARNKNTVPLLAGYTTRLLSDYKLLEGEELVKLFAYSMSFAGQPAVAAAWLEGFLKGSGTILLIDEDLWSLVRNWVGELDEENFVQLLPLLRRTFAHYSSAERRKLGEKVKQGAGPVQRMALAGIDEARAKQGIDIILTLFGNKPSMNGD